MEVEIQCRKNLNCFSELVVGAPGFEPGTSCAQGNCKNSISLVRLALFCVMALGFGPNLSTFGPKWTQVFSQTRQTAGRRDLTDNAAASTSKKQRFVFALEIRESSRDTGQDCSSLASIHAFKRGAQVEFLPVYRGVLRYDPAGLASASCLQQTLDVLDSLNVPFPKFEFGVDLPRYRSRKPAIEPAKMCKQLSKFLPILRFR